MATFTGSCGPEYSPFENAIYHERGGYSQFQNDSLGYHAENAEKMVSLGESYSNICDSIVDESERQAPIFSLANLQRRFLELHNRDRRRFGLDDLVWDTNLANYAQRWANYLKENHGCEMRHRSQLGETEGKSYGENLAFYWTSQNLPQGTFGSTPDLAVNSWDAECADYDLVSNSCSVGKVCGHFTQVVWEKSKRVGCAVATCNAGDKNYNRAGRAEVWVCNYDPPGNMSISHGGVITKLKPFSEIVRKPTGSDEGSMAEDEPQSLPAIGSKSSSRVVLYGNPGCIFCQMSEEALKKEGIQYEFNNINADVQLRNKIVNDVGPQRYPYVFVDGKYIGGLPELQAMINNKELSANAGPSLARPPEKISDLKPPPVPAFEPVGRSGTLGKSAKRVVLYGNPGCGLCKAAEVVSRKC